MLCNHTNHRGAPPKSHGSINTAAEHTPTIHLLSLNIVIHKLSFSVTEDEWSEHITVVVEEYEDAAPSTSCEFSETRESKEAMQVRSRGEERLPP